MAIMEYDVIDMYHVPLQQYYEVARLELVAEGPMCGDRRAEEVATKVRELFSDSLPVKERNLKRAVYLIEHAFALFDDDHDGRLNIENFISWEWAGFLSVAPAGKCTVTKEEFMSRYLGDPNDPLSGWHLSFQVESTLDEYKQYDRSGKGYITENDIRHKAMEEFAFTDVNKDGFISLDEFSTQKK